MTEWINYVRENLDKPWSYYYLSKNPNITWDIVKENPKLQWHCYSMSENPNITWSIVYENIRICHGIIIIYLVIQILLGKLFNPNQTNRGIITCCHAIRCLKIHFSKSNYAL